MRKYLVGAIAVGSLAFAAVAVAANFQTIEVEMDKTKVDEKKFKPNGIDVATTTGDENDPSATPSPATRAVIKFDKDLIFNTDAAKYCKQEDIDGTSTQAAIAACKKAKVGDGAATVRAFGNDFNAVVTAFNAKNDSLLLHSRVDSINTTTVLDGKLKAKKPGKKPSKLDVGIPPLPGGAAITYFQTHVKKGDYVTARCSDKKWDFSGKFTYQDGTSKKATDSVKCKQA